MPPYIFCVAYNPDNSLVIIDAANPVAPTLASVLTGIGPPNFLGFANCVGVYRGYAYVGQWQLDGLSIFDVSDPTAPFYVSGIYGAGVPNYLDRIHDICFQGDYAYVAALGDGLTILDISNPLVPVYRGGNYLAAQSGVPRGIVVDGDYVYMATGIWDGVSIFDVSNPAAPVMVGQITGAGPPPGGNWLQTTGKIRKSGNYIYVVAEQDDAMTIIDVTDPTNPVFSGSIQGAGAPNFLDWPMGLDIIGTVVVVVSQNDNSLSTFNVANPVAPVLLGSIQGIGVAPWLGAAWDVRVVENYAYVAASTDDSMTIISIAVPAAPVFTGRLNGAGAPNFLDQARGVFAFPLTLPNVQTDPATSVINNAASPNGTLSDDGGESCDCGFEYGETPAYGKTTPIQSRTTGQTFAQTLYPLKPNTTYYFRAFATNSVGTSYGAQRSFTTPQVSYYESLISPEVQTNPATLITEHTARPNGVVVEDGGVMGAVRFQWGLTTEYGNDTSWQQGYGKGDEFSVGLNNLAEGQGFHFRAQFRVGGKLVSGSDMVFNTLSSVGPVTLVTDEIIQLLEVV